MMRLVMFQNRHKNNGFKCYMSLSQIGTWRIDPVTKPLTDDASVDQTIKKELESH
jgi:hypothetical protein